MMKAQYKRNQRKLIRQGGTFMISLPKDYLIYLGWKPGDKILVERIENTVTLNKFDEEPKIYSIGYEGKTMNEFINLLEDNKIVELVDVRNNAFSWKKGFSKKWLSESLADSNIHYINLPKLGAPPTIRIEIKENQNPDKFFSDYSRWLKLNDPDLNFLDILARQRTSAMMCVEANFKNCHRKILGERLEDRGYEVIQL